MIQVAVISGKGGTGKTMLTSSLSRLLKGSLVLADCDVDAANMALVQNPRLLRTDPFMGMKAAVIDSAVCTECGTCRDYCRFNAVDLDGESYRINPSRCEGCAVCTLVCPANAVTMQPRQTGVILYLEISCGHLVHARLVPGAGNSGLLVHAVKKTALERDGDADMFLVDGPPGTGCPLISSVSGMNAVLVVTEPSVSGLHDLKRVVTVCRQFRPKIFVVVNRYDLDPLHTEEIESYCREEALPLLAKIPFDPAVIGAIRAGVPVTDFGESPASRAIRVLADDLKMELTQLNAC
ncbi:ATP-binding protein [uncultured Methanocorpusculum sp.]|nr:ATP-binding protein [uncultured Methanocorpusculum sp.]